MSAPRADAVGKVYLIGAGPGDPGLLTLRGCELLGRADLILYDYLVNPLILEHAAPQAERVCLGRHGADGTDANGSGHTAPNETGPSQDRIMRQEEINRRMVEAAQAGRTVCRLKGGDPAIFARLADEVHALKTANIEYEVVPGISAALALGSFAGVSLTDAESASAVAFVAGQEREGKDQSGLNFAALADFSGALIFYMGITTSRHWSAELMRHGKSPDTPVAVVRRCSWPDQTSFTATLATVADELHRRRLRPPALVVVGEVARRVETPSWFARRRLKGCRVLITRPQEGIDRLRRQLVELGAETLSQPAIELGPPADFGPLDAALTRLHEFDWLVFSSAHGVRATLDRLWSEVGDLRRLGAARIATIGPETAAALATYHLRADLVPETFRAESLVAALAPHVAGRRCLLLRASRGREVLAAGLSAAGATVEQVVAYESRDVSQPAPEILAALTAGRVDWVTVTSSAIARSLVAMFGEHLRHSRLVSISPITSETLRGLGYEPAAEATTYDLSGLVAAIR